SAFPRSDPRNCRVSEALSGPTAKGMPAVGFRAEGRISGSREPAEGLHRLVQARGPRMAAIEAKTILVAAASGEQRAWRHADPARARPLGQAARVDALRHLHPQHEAALRIADARAFRKPACDRLARPGDLLAIRPPDPFQELVVAARAEKRRNRQ